MRHYRHSNGFLYSGLSFWTDTTGAAWLMDSWGYLLPVPNVRTWEDTP